MKKSEIIENLKADVIKSPISLNYENGERKIIEPSQVQVNSAFVKLCDIWNSTEQSRNFMKHLIQSFLPLTDKRIAKFSEKEITDGTNRCCILGLKLAGINDLVDKLTEYQTYRQSIEAKAAAESRKLTEKESKNLLHRFHKLPIEIQNGTQAVSSDKSQKYLSVEANIALNIFVERALEAGDRDVLFTMKPELLKEHKAKSKEKRERRQEISKARLHRPTLSAFLDAESVEKLKESFNK